MAKISANTTVTYDTGLTRPRVIVVYEPLIGYNPDTIKIRVYPANPDQIVASGGSVRIAGNSAVQVEKEIVTFEATDTAIPALPATSALSVRTLDAIYDLQGNIIYPNFSLDPEQGIIRCDAAVIGAVEVNYTAGYTIADYIPDEDFKTQALEAVWIAAIKSGTVERLQIDSSVYAEALNYAELYSVTSTVVIDANGRWELPNDWPDNPNYAPGNTIPPDPETSATEARTHDRGVIDNRGRQQYDRPWVRYEQPFIGNPNYKPIWTYTQGNPPPGYETAFQDFDFAELKADLAKRYPGLEGL